MHFNGLQVITSVNLTVPGEPVEIPRSWRERLFTRPWQPLKRTRTVTPQIPHPGALIMRDKILMHPATYQKLKDTFGK